MTTQLHWFDSILLGSGYRLTVSHLVTINITGLKQFRRWKEPLSACNGRSSHSIRAVLVANDNDIPAFGLTG